MEELDFHKLINESNILSENIKINANKVLNILDIRGIDYIEITLQCVHIYYVHQEIRASISITDYISTHLHVTGKTVEGVQTQFELFNFLNSKIENV